MPDEARAIAARIHAERIGGRPFVPLQTAESARGVPFAYAIQKALVANVVRQDSGAISGYKLGLTSAAMQQKFAMAEPAYGFLGDPIHSPVTLSSGNYQHLLLECEIALRVGSVPSAAQLAGPVAGCP